MADKYKFINRIGAGSFGEVFNVYCRDTKQNYAAKVEVRGSKARLYGEYEIYKKLRKNGVHDGIPKIINYIETPKQNILIMTLLGYDLDRLQKDNGGKFDLATVLKIGISIVSLLQEIHNCGFIHRDIKPNNFITGYKEDHSNIYIMDFGLSKQYWVGGKHIPPKKDRDLVGTARYAGINVHMGFEPSRRDDLESVGYMLVYFLKGSLPWQGLRDKRHENKIKLIGELKVSTSLTKLCHGLPYCFVEFIKYCRKLSYEETPNYEHLKKLFIEEASKSNIHLKYCWCKN